jgi:plasmid maintenance system antidote protein VapI
MNEVFAFITKNGLTIREFAALAECSPKSLYVLRDCKAEIRISTANKLRRVMDTHLRKLV